VCRFKLSAGGGVLLFGPPGCGKTLLAEAIAGECKAGFIRVAGPSLLDAHRGVSESNIREVFARARAKAPCIIFFDELESLARARDDRGGGGGTTDSILSTISTEWDRNTSDRPVFVIGATNRPDLLDASLLRAGRFSSPLYVGLPDAQSRASIFQALLKGTPMEPEAVCDPYLSGFCGRTRGFSGADIAGVCNAARSKAMKRTIADIRAGRIPVEMVLRDDLELALTTSGPSVDPQYLEEYRTFRPMAYSQTEEETETLGELGDVNALLRRTIQKSQEAGASDEAMSTALRAAILGIQAKNEAKEAALSSKASATLEATAAGNE
jgi:transitional endoplasmic reticulum ATPase